MISIRGTLETRNKQGKKLIAYARDLREVFSDIDRKIDEQLQSGFNRSAQ